MSGVFTARQAEQGREVFNGSCTGCHTAASHTGAPFTTRWIGVPLSELFDYLSANMPKSNPGSLTEDEYVWVTAYLLKLNGMPAGTNQLTADAKLLESIRIDSVSAPKNAPGLSQFRPTLQHLLR
jgi:mono/diheme cytochrome c family protein